MFAVHTIIILIVALIVNAPVLKWRVRKLKNQNINFRDAYSVSIKALLVAVFIRDLIVIAVVSSFSFTSENVMNTVNVIILVISTIIWWKVHSNSLNKIEVSNDSFALEDARKITSSVLGCIIVGWFSFSVLFIIIISMTANY